VEGSPGAEFKEQASLYFVRPAVYRMRLEFPLGQRSSLLRTGTYDMHVLHAAVGADDAELTAILMRNSDRMLTLLGNARVVYDPSLDRTIRLDLRQHHFTHLAQHRIVGPLPRANKMQRLMLRRSAFRRCDRCP
jgi:hypothetical protein